MAQEGATLKKAQAEPRRGGEPGQPQGKEERGEATAQPARERPAEARRGMPPAASERRALAEAYEGLATAYKALAREYEELARERGAPGAPPAGTKRAASTPAKAAQAPPPKQPAPAKPGRQTGPEPAPARPAPPHEERAMHEVTPAEGPGSPGGIAKPGKAELLEGRDQGYQGRAAETREPSREGKPQRPAEEQRRAAQREKEKP